METLREDRRLEIPRDEASLPVDAVEPQSKHGSRNLTDVAVHLDLSCKAPNKKRVTLMTAGPLTRERLAKTWKNCKISTSKTTMRLPLKPETKSISAVQTIGRMAESGLRHRF